MKVKPIIFYTSILGFLLSAYLTVTFYTSNPFCLPGQENVCDIVSQSIWGSLFGLPVGIFGMASFICFILGTQKKYKLPLTTTQINGGLLALATFALGFETYISYMAKSVLGVLCPYCLIVYACLIVIFICALINVLKK